MGGVVGEETKFSLLLYSAEARRAKKTAQAVPDSGHKPSTTEKELFQTTLAEDQPEYETKTEDFERCVEEIRAVLVAAAGKTDEDKLKYSEALNRAVLGFEQERGQFLAIVSDQLAKKRLNHIQPPNRVYETLSEAVFAEVIGLHVLELVMKNRDGLEEIQVVGRDIYEVRAGHAIVSPYKFQNVKEVERIQQNLVLFNNEVINPRKRWAEVSLKDGSRVTMTGFGFTAEPTLTIRFYTQRYYSLDMLCAQEYGTINEPVRQLLLTLLRSRFNLVITGPTNSGKTSLIKALIAELPDDERLITIESRYELMLKRDFPAKNIIEYEIDEEDRQHSGSQAFKLALRQSPKRICHAEIRDEDANIYVRACTRGHEGSMTSVHVNALEDVPDAITDMCMLDGRGMNPRQLIKRITEYVTQIGIEMGLVDGRRKVLRIGEYVFAEEEVRVRDLVRYDHTTGGWTYPVQLSNKASDRVKKYNALDSAVVKSGSEERC
ncbi:ATPase, T2SS/T4P/T4SS family [Paenibacillus koleovorans]|uniref:ATPase, T2SS/T4P/T4SS family n=1 Tax=Paenibacillus koleovorans TaxID=121608 RepID=UPI000FD701DD|nr:ATPase, T2SS/T4P/T4SS family [Paenibacillus koleovorans]